MKYRELLEITKKHPNPFYIKEQHDKMFEQKYMEWVKKEMKPIKTVQSEGEKE